MDLREKLEKAAVLVGAWMSHEGVSDEDFEHLTLMSILAVSHSNKAIQLGLARDENELLNQVGTILLAAYQKGRFSVSP